MTTDSPKPDILLVPGGWHKPGNYAKIISLLNSRGYEVHCPSLPSMSGDESPVNDLDTDTSFIRDYTQQLVDSGKTLIAVLHSYGGQVGTNALCGMSLEGRAAKGLTGGIKHLIYVGGFALLEGRAAADIVEEHGLSHLIPLSFAPAENGKAVNDVLRAMLVGEDRGSASEEEYETYMSTVGQWNSKCMYDRISQCAWREIPVAYVLCTQDMTVPYEYQKEFLAALETQGVKARTFEINTGHCPNLTKPSELCDAIVSVATETPSA